MTRYMQYVNDGPWGFWDAGACGDITRDGKFVGSILRLDAMETVRLLNQRHRWLAETR